MMCRGRKGENYGTGTIDRVSKAFHISNRYTKIGDPFEQMIGCPQSRSSDERRLRQVYPWYRT
jgi:hypothetical protein